MRGTKLRHWTSDDFVVTSTNPAYDGSATVNRYGYCRACLADMQSFGHEGAYGPIKHYSSHGTARLLGLWGKGRGRINAALSSD